MHVTLNLQWFAGETLTTYDAMLKEEYGPAMVEELNQLVIALALFSRRELPLVGREFVLPAALGRNEGIGTAAEDTALPTAQNQVYADMKQTAAYLYAAFRVTAQTIELSRTDQGAFARAATIGMKRLRDDFRKDLNRQFHGDGTGTLATIRTTNASTTSSSTINVNDPANVNTFSKYLRNNQIVDILHSGAVISGASAVTVSALSTVSGKPWEASSAKFSVTGTITTTAGDLIVRTGNYNKEIQGLLKAVGAGSYANIDPATYPQWQSVSLGNSGTLRPLSEDLLQQGVDGCELMVGRAPDWGITTHEVRKALVNLLSSQRRFVNSEKMFGGFEVIDFGGRKIIVDPDAQNNKFYWITPDTWAVLQTRDMHWIDEDGTILHRDLNHHDAFYADMRWFAQLLCEVRGANALISDISE